MNIYHQQVRSLTISSELCEEYLSLCEQFADYHNKKAAKATLGVDVEAHHILPKAFNMGGERDKANITYLPLVEHRRAHQLLKDMFEGKFRRAMAFGYSRIIHRHGVKDSIPIEEYAAIRSEVGKLVSEINRVKNSTVSHRKAVAIAKKGTRWINDGTFERMIGPNEPLPNGWVEERLVCSIKGRIWITNGASNKMVYPGTPLTEGWRVGLTMKPRKKV